MARQRKDPSPVSVRPSNTCDDAPIYKVQVHSRRPRQQHLPKDDCHFALTAALASIDMAVVSPSRSEKARPRDALARLFKRHIGEDRFSEEDVALSRILQQTHIAGTPPRKPLPDLPSARTPSHFQHQGLKKLPHSVSLQFPVPGSNVCYYPAAQPSRHLAGPSSSYQIDSLPHMPIASPYIRRDHPASVDHLAVSTLPNPWELTAPKPAPSLPPAFLTSPRPIRPFSAPVLTTKKQPPRRSKSTIVDPLALPGVHQCWGIKRDGTRCTRKVVSATASPRKGRSPSKSPSPSKGRTGGAHADAIVISDSDDDLSDSCSDDDVRREYCFQHSKEINKTDGFVLPGLRRCGSKGRGEGAYVDFGPILAGIVRKGGQEEENCKAQLRTAMCKAPSEVDWVERGYIYIYEVGIQQVREPLSLSL